MKLKFLNFLTVCLLTLVVLSPALAVMGIVWQQHLDFMATQHFLYGVANGKNTTVYFLLWLVFFAPINLCVGIALHQRCVIYRAAVLQRQVEMLERLWQCSTYPEEITL